MSFTEQTDPNAPVTPPPAEAPVIAPKVSGGIAPDVKLPGRKVFLTAPQLAEIKEQDILGGTVSDSGDAATRQRRGFDVIFQGQKLLNKSGVLERGLYQDEEAESELARMTKADRDLFKTL
jgi:hypothetical protein